MADRLILKEAKRLSGLLQGLVRGRLWLQVIVGMIAGTGLGVLLGPSVGTPPAGGFLIMGVDRILDMARTMTNVWSDSSGALVIGHTEGEIDESVLFGASTEKAA